MSTKEQLSFEAEQLGTTLGTPAHARAVRKLQVEKCRELNVVTFCSDCRNYYDCTLIKQHRQDVAEYGEHK